LHDASMLCMVLRKHDDEKSVTVARGTSAAHDATPVCHAHEQALDVEDRRPACVARLQEGQQPCFDILGQSEALIWKEPRTAAKDRRADVPAG